MFPLPALANDALTNKICKEALSKIGDIWDPNIHVQTSVKQAEMRGFLPTDCAQILGRTDSAILSQSSNLKKADHPTSSSNFPNWGVRGAPLNTVEKPATVDRTLKNTKLENRNLKKELERLKQAERRNLSSIQSLKKKLEKLITEASRREVEEEMRGDEQEYRAAEVRRKKEAGQIAERKKEKQAAKQKRAEARRFVEEKKKKLT